VQIGIRNKRNLRLEVFPGMSMGLAFLRLNSYRKGAVLSSALSFAGQAAGLLTNIALAYYFGTSEVADIYYYCLFVVTLVAGSLTALDAATIVPEAQRLHETEGVRASMGHVNAFLYIFLLLAALLSIGMFLCPVGLFTKISHYNPDLLLKHASIVYWSIPLVIATTASQFILDILMAYKFFTLPALFGFLTRGIVLASVVIFHDRFSVVSALLGTLLANLLVIGSSVVLMRRALDWDFAVVRPMLNGKALRYLGYCAAGQVASTLAAFAPYYLLGGRFTGVVAAMSYAQRIATLPLQLCASQFLSVLGVKLNEQHARSDWRGLDSTLIKSSNALSFLLLPIALFMCVYASEIVQILLQRGSFDKSSATSTAVLLRYFVLAIPLTALSSVAARLFMASQRMKYGFYFQIGVNVLLILAIVAGVRLMGVAGYPMAQLLVGLLNLLFLIVVNRHLYPYYHYTRTLTYLVRVVCVCLVIAGLLVVVRRHTLVLGPLASLGIGFVLFSAVWYAINKLYPLNKEATGAIIDGIRRLLSRAS
jgi:putative peptidoglycan lipid II flippase